MVFTKNILILITVVLSVYCDDFTITFYNNYRNGPVIIGPVTQSKCWKDHGRLNKLLVLPKFKVSVMTNTQCGAFFDSVITFNVKAPTGLTEWLWFKKDNTNDVFYSTSASPCRLNKPMMISVAFNKTNYGLIVYIAGEKGGNMKGKLQCPIPVHSLGNGNKRCYDKGKNCNRMRKYCKYRPRCSERRYKYSEDCRSRRIVRRSCKKTCHIC